MSPAGKKWILTFVKFAIAVAGLWFVITRTPWNDVATLGKGSELLGVVVLEPVDVTLLPAEKPQPGAVFVALPKRAVKMRDANGREFSEPLAKQLTSGQRTRAVWIPRDRLVRVDGTDEPKIQVGLKNLVRHARPGLLLAAWAVLLLPFLITAWRWKKLMEPQGIRLSYAKCLALTFVGQFYSTFLPGITGGDLVKIIYTAKVTGSKTKSTITILLDRVLGLVALLVIAGASAALQAHDNPTMLRVAAAIGLALLGGVVLTAIYFSRRMRNLLGIERLTENARERLAARAAAREHGEEVIEEPDTAGVNAGRTRLLWRTVGVVLCVCLGLAVKGGLALFWPLGLRYEAAAGALAGLSVLLVWWNRTPSFAPGSTSAARVVTFRQRSAEVVAQLDSALHVYRHHVGVLALAFGVSLITQLIMPLSAWLAGLAFGMPSPVGYYFAYVPLALLAASVPIAPPQGFGVTEWMLFHFMSQRGAETVRALPAQTFALAQAVRFLPVAWNMVGALWVVTGTYTRSEVMRNAECGMRNEGQR